MKRFVLRSMCIGISVIAVLVAIIVGAPRAGFLTNSLDRYIYYTGEDIADEYPHRPAYDHGRIVDLTSTYFEIGASKNEVLNKLREEGYVNRVSTNINAPDLARGFSVADGVFVKSLPLFLCPRELFVILSFDWENDDKLLRAVGTVWFHPDEC